MLLLADIPSAGGAPAADALQQLANAVRANPADPRTHLALISRQVQYADKDSALTAAQAATAALPNDLSILEALGQTQLIAGKVQQAVSTFRKLTALLPASAAAQMNLAEACVAATDFDMASRAMRRALELDPRRGDAHRGLAMLALRDKRIADALRIAHEMQQLDPKGALGYATEGDIEAKRKNWPAAVAAFQSALRYSDASEAAIKLHVVLGASRQAAEADRLVADWERRRPSDPAFRFYLGDVAMNQQKFAEAEVHYRAVLVNQPRNALAMNNIAWLLHKQSKPGGLAMVEQANALMPHRAPILDTLALILAATGKVSEAVKAQRQAIAAAPQDPTLKLALARYLIQDGKTSEARAQLKALAELGDNYTGQPEVQKLLKSI
jgi:putative PEP-CTERM system TPR-repeat lipoprotein